MTALLQKDLYVLWKQMRFYAVLIVVYALVPNTFLNVFGVVYGAILPYTAMAYDERAKWDQLAAMMPYRDWDLVASKYVLGAMFSAVAAVTAVAAQSVIHRFYQAENGDWFTPEHAVICFGLALTIMAVAMPVLFRFTVEKARVIILLLIFVVAGGSGALAAIVEDSVSETVAFRIPLPAAAAFLLAGVVLMAVSIPISVRMYRRRRL